jgi:hypothetical protein
MTARTALTPTALVQDGGVAEPAGTSIAGLISAGATVASPPGPNKVFLIVTNSDSGGAHTVTVSAGGNGVTASGGTNPGVPFEAATVGDLAVSVAASSTQLVGPFTSDRFIQADGSMSIDFSSGFTGTIAVIQLPNAHIVEGF